MADEEKRAQDQPAGGDANDMGQTAANAGPGNQTDQASAEKKEDSKSTDAAQTGEGTGAKAGEYS